MSVQLSSIQLFRHVRLFATPWPAACQASLSIANSQSLLKLMSIESVMPSNHLILCHPVSPCLQSFPASRSFSMSQLFTWLFYNVLISFVILCSVTKLCPSLCNPMDCSTPCPALHYLLEFAQTHVYWVGDAIQPSHPLSPLLLLPSIFLIIRVFPNELALWIRWPKYWSFSFSISLSNEYLGLISFRMDWFDPHFAERETNNQNFTQGLSMADISRLSSLSLATGSNSTNHTPPHPQNPIAQGQEK